MRLRVKVGKGGQVGHDCFGVHDQDRVFGGPELPVGPGQLQVPGVGHQLKRFGNLIAGLPGHGHYQGTGSVYVGGNGERAHDSARDGMLDGGACASQVGQGIIEVFVAADKDHSSSLDGGAQAVGAQGLFREDETFRGIGAVQSAGILGIDNAPRHDPAILVSQEEGHPGVREVVLPLVKDPAGGAQDGAVRINLTEDVRPGGGIDTV